MVGPPSPGYYQPLVEVGEETWRASRWDSYWGHSPEWTQKSSQGTQKPLLWIQTACVCDKLLSRIWLLWPHGLQPTRLLCPWGFSREEYWTELPCPSDGPRFKYWLSFNSLEPLTRFFSSVQFTHSCPTLCDPTDCSMPGLPVYHQLLEFNQTFYLRMSIGRGTGLPQLPILIFLCFYFSLNFWFSKKNSFILFESISEHEN